MRFEIDKFEFVYEFENLKDPDEAEKTDPVYLEIDISKSLLKRLKTTVGGEYTFKGKNRCTKIIFNSSYGDLEVIDNHISKEWDTSFPLLKDIKKQLIEFLEKIYNENAKRSLVL